MEGLQALGQDHQQCRFVHSHTVHQPKLAQSDLTWFRAQVFLQLGQSQTSEALLLRQAFYLDLQVEMAADDKINNITLTILHITCNKQNTISVVNTTPVVMVDLEKIFTSGFSLDMLTYTVAKNVGGGLGSRFSLRNIHIAINAMPIHKQFTAKNASRTR